VKGLPKLCDKAFAIIRPKVDVLAWRRPATHSDGIFNSGGCQRFSQDPTVFRSPFKTYRDSDTSTSLLGEYIFPCLGTHSLLTTGAAPCVSRYHNSL
jgi:hypothetical protein